MTAFMIPSNDLYLLGVLNSKVVFYFYLAISSQVRGGYLRYKSQYVKQIPIPQVSANEKEKISKLVQKCLNGQGQNIGHWEAEIDDRVRHLYGLTAHEMAQITGR